MFGLWKREFQEAQRESKAKEASKAHLQKQAVTIGTRDTLVQGSICGFWGIEVMAGGLVPSLSFEDMISTLKITIVL